MNTCDKITKNMTKYLDGDIDESLKVQIETHLKNCPECHKKIDEIKFLSESLSSLPNLKTSQNFDIIFQSRLRREIMNERSLLKGRQNRFLFKVPAFAGAGVILLFLGFFLGQTLSSQNNGSLNNPLPLASYSTPYTVATESKNNVTDRAKMKNYVIEVARPNNFPTTRRNYRLSSNRSNDTKVIKTQNQQQIYKTQTKSLVRKASTSVRF